MILSHSIRKYTTGILAQRLAFEMISHKFYNGQGGTLRLDLSKRTYKIQLQTIWEDFCLMQISGLSGIKNLVLKEDNKQACFADSELDSNLDEVLEVKLKIPEDYTLDGLIQGSLEHQQGQVGRKLRSNPFCLKVEGKNNRLSLGDVKSEKIQILNQHGSVHFSGLTVQEGSIQANIIQCKKLMTSNAIHLQAQGIDLRSLLMFGSAKGYLKSKELQIDSISGYSEIESQRVKIDRYYGGNGNINVNCCEVKQKIGVQTGTGKIKFANTEEAKKNLSKVQLGRMHKGSIRLDDKEIQIQ